jgi:hypothetical protein
MKDQDIRHLLQQETSGNTISHLSARQQEGDGSALAIAQGVDLCGPPAA